MYKLKAMYGTRKEKNPYSNARGKQQTLKKKKKEKKNKEKRKKKQSRKRDSHLSQPPQP